MVIMIKSIEMVLVVCYMVNGNSDNSDMLYGNSSNMNKDM